MKNNFERTLIVFFSYSNTTRNIAETLCNHIDKLIKAYYHDTTLKKVFTYMYELKPVNPYPNDYQATLNQAQYELKNDILPYYQHLDFEMIDYDVVYLCMPVWCDTIPPVVKTFLALSDFRKKVIVPFVICDGNPGHSIEDIAKISKATIENPLVLKYNEKKELVNRQDLDICLGQIGVLPDDQNGV